MNIDERLEKLTERQQALTQSLELLSHMHQENERDFNQVLTALAEAQIKSEEAIGRLAHIADIQDRRITRIEDRPQ